MAGSVSNRVYDIELTVTTNHYEEEVEDVITDALESAGIEVEDITVKKG